MRHLFSIIILAQLSFVVKAEQCQIEYLEELQYRDIECQFYMGTKAFRNKVHSVAAAHWRFVVDSPSEYEGDDELKAMALSTLNFLSYHGMGVEQDRIKAVESWKESVAKGDLEARRHLGVAYSDQQFKDNNLIESAGWFQSILLRYPDPTVLGENDLSIYKDAQVEFEQLKTQLSESQLKKAEEFARNSLKM